MEIILLEKVRNLGDIGAKANVKAGYARNFLIPYGKAVVANAANLTKFESMRAGLEQKAVHNLELAKARAKELTLEPLIIAVKATEDGKLFGSVGTSVIVQAFAAKNLVVKQNEVSLPQGVIRQLGEHEVVLLLGSDVTEKIVVRVVAE